MSRAHPGPTPLSRDKAKTSCPTSTNLAIRVNTLVEKHLTTNPLMRSHQAANLPNQAHHSDRTKCHLTAVKFWLTAAPSSQDSRAHKPCNQRATAHRTRQPTTSLRRGCCPNTRSCATIRKHLKNKSEITDSSHLLVSQLLLPRLKLSLPLAAASRSLWEDTRLHQLLTRLLMACFRVRASIISNNSNKLAMVRTLLQRRKLPT